MRCCDGRRWTVSLGGRGEASPDRVDDVFVLDSQLGPLVFDRGAAQLTRGEGEIHLTITEYRLLSVLAENAGRVLSRDSLLEHVWQRGFFGDERIVDVHVRRLRKKIETDPELADDPGHGAWTRLPARRPMSQA